MVDVVRLASSAGSLEKPTPCKGMKLTVHGDGSNKRSYLYVEDVAAAFDIVLYRGSVGRVYNIGIGCKRPHIAE